MARGAKKNVAVVEAAPGAVVVVTEAELRSVLNDRKTLADLKATVRATEKRLDMQEQALIAKLRKGAKVEGKLTAIVQMVKGRVCVSWKDVCADLCVRFGLHFETVEQEERAKKEGSILPEPTLVVSESAIEQYVGSEVK